MKALELNKPAERTKHTIEDISFTQRPLFCLCSCGWREEANTPNQINELWRAHQTEARLAAGLAR